MAQEKSSLCGVLSPVLTPFDAALKPDPERLVQHCRWLVSNDVGLALFGTNSEANSLSLAERINLLESVVEAGLPTSRMMPGTATCNLPETVEITRHAVSAGVAGVLMLPPFYYKGVSDDGLFDYFSRVIDGVGDDRLRIYLYHIPPVAQVPITLNLIERLLKAFPDQIKGVKDSSGDWKNTLSMIEAFASDGFEVFAGSEPSLLQCMQAGGAGCISATANVNPAAIADLYRNWTEEDAQSRQDALTVTRGIFGNFVMIPAMKAAVAHYSGSPDWLRVRPPLVEMDTAQIKMLTDALDDAGFRMPGLEGMFNA